MKDDWEASEDSDAEKQEAPKPKGPVRNKGITKMKIAEKEAEEANRLAEMEAAAAEEADPILRKKREQQRTVEADMESARGLFGDAVISCLFFTTLNQLLIPVMGSSVQICYTN